MKRAVRDFNLPSNPVKQIDKPSQRREREPLLVSVEQVETMRLFFRAHIHGLHGAGRRAATAATSSRSCLTKIASRSTSRSVASRSARSSVDSKRAASAPADTSAA
jgi:hypothetical protein